MGSLQEWLDEQLKSPVGQIVYLAVGIAARLAYGYLRKHKRRKRRVHRPSSPKA